jgi:hypothetical protein
MRKKLIALIIFIIALSLLVIGIIEAQYLLIPDYYDKMSNYPAFGP